MKKMLFALALCGLTFACATEEKASFTDGNPAMCTDCDAGDCGECPEAKSECAGAKAECASEAKVCPVTGKVMN